MIKTITFITLIAFLVGCSMQTPEEELYLIQKKYPSAVRLSLDENRNASIIIAKDGNGSVIRLTPTSDGKSFIGTIIIQ